MFSDGTIWDRATIAANAWVRGTSGADSITAPSDGATIDPGTGDDSISISGNGSDRIIFAKGDGHDTLNNPSSGYNRNDTLQLTDINSSEVLFSRSGNALLLSVPSTGDTFKVNFQFWGDGSQIQGLTNIQFADGTSWNRSAISDAVSTFTWAGSSSNPMLTGNNYGHTSFSWDLVRRQPTAVPETMCTKLQRARARQTSSFHRPPHPRMNSTLWVGSLTTSCGSQNLEMISRSIS
jgi:hypothetical protein